jgi:hypothetical protein
MAKVLENRQVLCTIKTVLREDRKVQAACRLSSAFNFLKVLGPNNGSLKAVE